MGESRVITIAFAVARKPVSIAPNVSDELKIAFPLGSTMSNRHQHKPPEKARMYGAQISKYIDFITSECSSTHCKHGLAPYTDPFLGSEDRPLSEYHQTREQASGL